MAQSVDTVDQLWIAFRDLPRERREQFMEKMVSDSALRQEIEDLLDLETARERANEPVRPLDDVLAEIGK